MICFIINFIGISFYSTKLCYCLQRAKTWGGGLIFTCYELPKFRSSQELMIYGLRAFIFKIIFRDFSSTLSPVILFLGCQSQAIYCINVEAQIAKFMRPTLGPPGSCRPQMGPCWPHEPCYQGGWHVAIHVILWAHRGREKGWHLIEDIYKSLLQKKLLHFISYFHDICFRWSILQYLLNQWQFCLLMHMCVMCSSFARN